MLRSSLRSVRAQDANIGFSTFDKFFYSPVKNNPADAAKKVAAGMDGACAASGEADVYAFSARLLGLEGRGADGAAVPPCACGSLDGPSGVYLGVPAALSPTLVLSPAFAVTTSEAASKVRGDPHGSFRDLRCVAQTISEIFERFSTEILEKRRKIFCGGRRAAPVLRAACVAAGAHTLHHQRGGV